MRKEFSRNTKREALRRSEGKCEAVGEWYDLPPGKRCNADLAYGVQFDHIDMDANSKDNSLSNCAAVCIKCHKHKTFKHDIPTNAKVKRVRDKNAGIIRSKNPMPGSRASKYKRTMDGRTVLR